MSTENPAVDISAGLAAPSQPVAPPSQAVNTSAPTADPVDTTVPGDPNAPQEGKRDRKVEKRIGRLTQQKEAALREAGYWRGVAAAKAQGAPQEPDANAPRDPEPTPQQKADFEAEQEFRREARERLEDSGKDIEDFDEVMETLTSDDFPMTRTMRDHLAFVSDSPGPMAKWLADNLAEAKKISRMEPAIAARALEKAEARLPKAAATPPKKVTGAPPPVSTVGGGSMVQVDVSKLSMDDYATRRRRQA